MTWVMYDSVDISKIPAHAQCVAGYVGGRWVTYPKLREKFPHAHVLSIAVNAHEDAHCLDVEAGDATPDQVPAWVHRQHERGVAKPVLYAQISTMPAVFNVLRTHGIHRSKVRLWSAHYTDHPHVCTRQHCGFILPEQHIDGTQWTSHAHGGNLDESLLHEWFFPHPL